MTPACFRSTSIPKLAWALKFRGQFPVDVNRAPREMLLRVPGLGVKAVDRIAVARGRWRRLRLDDVARLTLSLDQGAAVHQHGRLAADHAYRRAARLLRPSSWLFAATETRPAAAGAVLRRPLHRLRSARRMQLCARWSDDRCSPRHPVAPDDFEGWRDAARDLAEAGVRQAPSSGRSKVPTPTCSGRRRRSRPLPSFPVPRAFVDLAETSSAIRDPERFALLYAMLLRLKTNKRALDDAADPLVRRLPTSPRRCVATSTRCTRSSASAIDDRRRHRFVAFFEPEHHIVRARRGLLRQPLRQHALVDPDAGAVDPLGRRDADAKAPARPAPTHRRATRSRRLAHLLRIDLQPGAAEGRRDAEGDAEEILAQHAGDLARSAADCRCPQPRAAR